MFQAIISLYSSKAFVLYEYKYNVLMRTINCYFECKLEYE